MLVIIPGNETMRVWHFDCNLFLQKCACSWYSFHSLVRVQSARGSLKIVTRLIYLDVLMCACFCGMRTDACVEACK